MDEPPAATRSRSIRPRLDGRVALVAGASRGVGLGVAEGLGEAGAIVYVTGRSARGGPTPDGMPGTVEATAERVAELGGDGVAVRCDHLVDDEVEALVDRIEAERGRLDVLVNNVWGGYEGYDADEWRRPFWELPAERWRLMVETGLGAKYRTARGAAPLLLGSDQGLVVNVSSPVGDAYDGHLLYWVVNHAVDRMTRAMAEDLRPHGVAAVSVQPGFTRTERVEAAYKERPDREAAMAELDEATHSPRYVGRAVAALAADPGVLDRTGEVLAVGVLALAYGFTDVDGRQPQWPPPGGGEGS